MQQPHNHQAQPEQVREDARDAGFFGSWSLASRSSRYV